MKIISSIAILLVVLSSMGGCHSSRMQTSSEESSQHDTVLHRPPEAIKFSFHLKTLLSLTHPDDEINIDTNGQMIFELHQLMNSGKWRNPTGFSYMNKLDDDTLWSFIKKSSLFDVQIDDVKPECPDGDLLFISIYRSDLNKTVSFQTNTCAKDYNLLTGEQRQYFPQFLAFLQRVRDKYRPHLKE